MRTSEYNELAERLGAPVQYRGAVISVHGMNTRGAWQKDVNTAFQDAFIRHRAVDFGWRVFGVIRRGTCDGVAADILRAYEDQLRYHPQPSAVGHSFGSLAIARGLKIFPDLALSRIVLFGSIVACDYPWDSIHSKGQVQAVLNERSASDIWPRVSKYCIPDSGPSGVDGFTEGQAFIRDAEHPWTGHSGLTYELHARRTWVPFLLGTV